MVLTNLIPNLVAGEDKNYRKEIIDMDDTTPIYLEISPDNYVVHYEKTWSGRIYTAEFSKDSATVFTANDARIMELFKDGEISYRIYINAETEIEEIEED